MVLVFKVWASPLRLIEANVGKSGYEPGLWPWCSYATDNASLMEAGIVIRFVAFRAPKVYGDTEG